MSPMKFGVYILAMGGIIYAFAVAVMLLWFFLAWVVRTITGRGSGQREPYL